MTQNFNDALGEHISELIKLVKKAELEFYVIEDRKTIKKSGASILRLEERNRVEESKVYKENPQKIGYGRDEFDEQLESSIGALNEIRRAKRIRENKSAIQTHREMIVDAKERIIESKSRMPSPTISELKQYDDIDIEDIFGFKK